jgi:expansin (peptidoglycan-binding protein)
MMGARWALLGLGLGLLASTAACGSDDNNADGGGGTTSGGKTSTGGKASTGGKTSTGTAGKTSSGGPPTTSGDTFGDAHEGVYHLGPVDFAETQWHNACAPAGKYRSALQSTAGLAGEYLAGVSNAFNGGGSVCDACILIETGKGKSIIARVVTYGVEMADGDIDVSPAVYDAIHQNEFPRSQTWHFARCPEAGPLQYEFQTEANIYWTSLWVRNPRVPLAKAEVKKKGASDFIELTRAGDGTLTDASGFGDGAFTFRLTGMDGQVVTDDLTGFKAGELVKSSKLFD